MGACERARRPVLFFSSPPRAAVSRLYPLGRPKHTHAKPDATTHLFQFRQDAVSFEACAWRRVRVGVGWGGRVRRRERGRHARGEGRRRGREASLCAGRAKVGASCPGCVLRRADFACLTSAPSRQRPIPALDARPRPTTATIVWSWRLVRLVAGPRGTGGRARRAGGNAGGTSKRKRYATTRRGGPSPPRATRTRHGRPRCSHHN